MEFLEKHLGKIIAFIIIGSFLGFFSGGIQIPTALWIVGFIYMANKQDKEYIGEGDDKGKLPLYTKENDKFELSDEMIIRLARIFQNKLSVDDLITQSSLTREQAKNRLDSLAQKGICEIKLDEIQHNGKIFYYFD